MAVAIDSKWLEFHDLPAPGDVLCSVRWMPQFATPTRVIAESFNCTKFIKYLVFSIVYPVAITICT